MRYSAAQVLAAMVALFVCGMCSRSDAHMVAVTRHQHQSNVDKLGGPYHDDDDCFYYYKK